MSVKQENVKWVDGLRGFASLLVVSTHIARAWDEELFKPVSHEHGSPRLFQYPILRLLVQGRIGVTIFALVTGYVCALKPIRQCAAGDQAGCFQGIAKSAFRRIPRLVFPAWIATTIIWFICQFGVFEVANRVDGWWLNYTSPNITPYIGQAIKSWVYYSTTTWTRSHNIYDNNQWTLMPLLKGAFLVYTMLISTAYMQPRYRMMVSLMLYVYYWICNDSAFGMQFFFGVFLSDLSQYKPHVDWMNARKWPSRFLTPPFILIGLLIASYPEHKPEWMPWSNFLLQLSKRIFPHDPETPRFYSGIGLEFIALGIHLSPMMKNALSNKYLLWFGKNSFAVYLIHGTLLRTVLVWMYYGFSTPPDIIKENGERVRGPNWKICGRLRFYFWLPIWFVGMYYCAHLWTKHVDPFCARLTAKLEAFVFVDKDKQDQGVLAEKKLLPK